MRSFRDVQLVAVTAFVVVLFAGACAGDDPPDPVVEPAVGTSTSGPAVSLTSTVPVTTAVPEPVGEQEAVSAYPVVQAWVASAWVAPVSDPFGYDYSLWVVELAAPSADIDGLRAGPRNVSLAEVAERDWDGSFWERTSGDLRSMLWLTAALDGGSDSTSSSSGWRFSRCTWASNPLKLTRLLMRGMAQCSRRSCAASPIR